MVRTWRRGLPRGEDMTMKDAICQVERIEMILGAYIIIQDSIPPPSEVRTTPPLIIDGLTKVNKTLTTRAHLLFYVCLLTDYSTFLSNSKTCLATKEEKEELHNELATFDTAKGPGRNQRHAFI